MGWWNSRINALLRKGKTWVGLSGREKLLLTQAMVLLPLVTISLHLFGLKLTQHWLAVLPKDAAVFYPNQQQIWTTVRMVRVANRYQYRWANCLKRSLVLQTLLRLQGIESDLRIGVQQQAGQFLAHAWVEHAGRILNDTDDVTSRYQAFQHSFSSYL